MGWGGGYLGDVGVLTLYRSFTLYVFDINYFQVPPFPVYILLSAFTSSLPRFVVYLKKEKKMFLSVLKAQVPL